jgi:hypothetical protein
MEEATVLHQAAVILLLVVLVYCTASLQIQLVFHTAASSQNARLVTSVDYRYRSTEHAELKQLLPPHIAMNISSCLWIHHIDYGRSGNRLVQIAQVNTVLTHCSGVATSSSDINQDFAVAFPPITLAIRGQPNIDSHLEFASRKCREVNYTWLVGPTLMKGCSNTPDYQIYPQVTDRGQDRDGLSSGMILNVYTDINIWKKHAPTDLMVMYFRGGDILRPNANKGYSQAPCSLFLEAWTLVNSSSVMLVFDPKDDVNPCVDVVRKAIPAAITISTPCDGVGCHLTWIGLASYVVISGFSTFANQAISLFPNRRRVIFRYFCSDPPVISQNSISVCAAGNTTAFSPWTYTETTRSQMISTPSTLVLGNHTKQSLRHYLEETLEM